VRRAIRGTAWGVLLVTMLTVSLYVGLLVKRQVNPPIVPITSSNDIAPYQQGDALLVRRISATSVTSGMIIAARIDGKVVLGKVRSLRRAGGRIVYELTGVHRGKTDTATDGDLIGRTDRRIPLIGVPLLAARSGVVQVAGAGVAVGVVLLLVFVGRNPLDFLEDDDDDEPFELPRPAPLALGAGEASLPSPGAMPYVEHPMAITPDDLRQVRFAQTRKGYDTEAVDRALDTVADSLESMYNERGHLIERLQAVEAELERYKALESQLGQTLAAAEKSAEHVKAEAHAEAQRILAEAQAGAGGAVAASGHPDATTVELLGEMRAIRALLQSALQPGGPLQQQRPPGQQ
jgi:DivIVA domain-containing protein